MERKTLRLKPKMDPRRLRHGFPWVYANEVVTDRRTRNIPAGTIGTLVDQDQNPLGTVAINPGSTIIGRVLDTDPEAAITGDWIAQKLRVAHDLRTRLFDQPYYRWVHAEADGLPGVIIDRFADVVVMQPNAAWADQMLDAFVTALMAFDGVATVILNGTGRARGLEQLEEVRKVVAGPAPTGPVPVPMNGATYFADLSEGQKTGLFFDQRPNHAFLQGFTPGADVLDVFSHVGGFGLAARAAGASSVTCIDSSAPALELAQRGADATPGPGSFDVMKSDGFAALTRLAEEGRIFDVVICDPPAFAPSKQALEAGLRAYERIARLATALVKPGGYLVLCSCSHAATLEKFRTACSRGIGRAGASAQLIHTGEAGADHPKHLMLAESGYLKSLFFRVL